MAGNGWSWALGPLETRRALQKGQGKAGSDSAGHTSQAALNVTLAWHTLGVSDTSFEPFQILIHLPLTLATTAAPPDRSCLTPRSHLGLRWILYLGPRTCDPGAHSC